MTARSPKLYLGLSVGLFLLLLILQLKLLLGQPTIPIKWQVPESGVGLLVSYSDRAEIKQGERVLALVSEIGRVELGKHSIIEEPDNVATFKEYSEVFDHNERLCRVLEGEQLHFEFSNKRVAIDFEKQGLQGLSLGMWIINFCALAGLLFGVGVWCRRPDQVATKILAAGGVLLVVASMTSATYSHRGLCLDPDWFLLLNQVNHLTMSCFACSLLALLWYYPKHLGRFPAFIVIIAVPVINWINEQFEWWEWPAHAFYQFMLVPYTVSIIFTVMQWRATRKDPVARASLLWFLFSVYFSTGSVLLLYLLPPIFGSDPLVPLWLAHLVFLFLFIGFVLGVVRFRLFDIETWWFKSWMWLISGLIIVAIDIALVSFLQLQILEALGFAVLLTAWIYFPLRQWFWNRFFRRGTDTQDGFLLNLITVFETSKNAREFSSRWWEVLEDLYLPASTKVRSLEHNEVSLDQHGFELAIPGISEGKGYLLQGRNQSSKLFTPADVKLVTEIRDLAGKLFKQREAKELGANLERGRITRDLHDDVGAKLLTLSIDAKSEEDRQTARESLQLLRETIQAMDDQRQISLSEASASWRSEAVQRFEGSEIKLDWPIKELGHEAYLDPRLRVNLSRIIREALSNVLKVSDCTEAQVALDRVDSEIRFTLSNNGVSHDVSFSGGTGVSTIKTRTEEVGGRVKWDVKQSGEVLFKLSVPLS